MTRGLERLVLAVLALAVLGADRVHAQRARQGDRRCQLVIQRVDREGVRSEPSPGVENFFAGGNVHVRCRGQNIHMYADSLASYGGSVVQFIGKVRYRDSTTALDADFGTYFREGEHFDAQGNVKHRDLESGSTIVGPRIDYYRPLPNVRPEFELKAFSRPTFHFVIEDSVGKATEPYVIIANTVRTVGGDVMYAGGDVRIDRSDLRGRSDSLWIDSGKREQGQLLGNAELHGGEQDSFHLVGKNIDLKLQKKELTGLTAKEKANLTSKDVTLDADSIRIQLVDRAVEVIRAWGKEVRPRALSGDYLVLGDSLVIETPGQQLRSVRAYGNGWAGFRPDSGQEKRDWIAGETVIASFVERDSAGVKTSAIKELEAIKQARSFYKMNPDSGATKGSINYTRADHIVVKMRVTGDSNAVERVSARGNVDGVHLQPAVARADSAAVDTTFSDSLPPRDTTTVRDTTLLGASSGRRRR